MTIQPKILVVEDSPTTRRQITDILQGAGYEVVAVEDGESAIEVVHEHDFVLAVLDIVLPKKNGYQVCRNFKSDPELAIKVLMLTAKDQDKDRFWGHRQGADGYLSKPVDADDLVTAIAEMISVQVRSLN